MKLIVFGGTGGTGKEVLKQSLEAGHEVTAIVRNPHELKMKHKLLQIVKGDVLDVSTIQSYMEKQDAVVSCLGVKKREPTSLYSRGSSHILQLMQEYHVNRFICLSSSGLEIPADLPFYQKWVIYSIIQPMYKYAYADMKQMEEIVKKSGVNWTIIRPPRLTNGPITTNYRTSLNKHLAKAQGISRSDLAHLMLTMIEDTKTFQTTIEVSY
ncbi:NAD(P)-dependent oxidoreductase [Shimazuella kribbensis]|uniref:NAD(P)-dependent oxidoreductase n=1 Tax=Shimazuella kribbensis TaxID=139808 RepID=UPI000410900E|nr:SDR family oxidoreductase [Shimazuella kribbensis]